ncbi:MAG: hypothetical protein RIR51_101 [Bacteroidota bacterium]
MLRKYHQLPIYILIFLFSLKLNGQDYLPTQKKVESHRIQYENFDWKFLASNNFEIYFYGNNEKLAEKTLQYSINETKRISKILGYYGYNKVKIFIHDSPYDLIQDNSGISTSSNKELVNLNLSNFKIQIAMEENMADYEKRLTTNLANLYFNDMLFGGSIKESIQNSILLNVPEWYSRGIIAYLVDGDSPEMNQYMIRAIASSKVRKLSLAQGDEAKYIGQSIFAYVANLYGNQVISNIINYTRIIRSEQSSFNSAIKKPFTEIIQDWYRFYLNKLQFYNSIVQSTDSTNLKNYEVDFSEIVSSEISEDGKYIASFNLTNSKMELKVENLINGTQKTFYQETRNELLDYASIQEPQIRWGKSNVLYVILKNKGKSYLYSFAVSDKDIKLSQKKYLGDYDVHDFKPANNGRRILVKYLNKGQFDLGFIDLNRGRLSSITNSPEEELEPQFYGQNNGIVYIQKDTDSTLSEEDNKHLKSVYYWDSNQTNGPEKLFSHIGNIEHLNNFNDSTWFFMVNKSNYKNLVFQTLDSSFSEEVLGPTSNWVDLQVVNNRIYFIDEDIFNKTLRSLPIEDFYQLKKVKYIPDYKNINEKDEFIGKIIQNNKDSNNIIREDYYSKKTLQRLERIQKRLDRLDDENQETGVSSKPYVNKFLFNDSNTDVMVDPFRGLGGKMDFLFNDFLENHLVKVGGWTNFGLNSLDLWSEYQYLAKKIDYKFRYDRKNIIQKLEYSGQRVRYNNIQLEASRPFNLYNKLSLSAIYTNNRAIDIYDLNIPEINWQYFGGKLEYKLENIISKNENEFEGQRLWLWVDAKIGLNDQSPSFTKFNLDYRKYLPINKFLSFRARFSASYGMGDRVPQTMIGGMDNWIFIQSEPRNNDNPLGYGGNVVRPDIFMSSVSSPLRGFYINKYSGGSHLLFNAQINLSVRELIGPLNTQTEFMKYLQFVGFFDIGTAWTGANPFTKYNGFNTNIYGGNTNPFIIKVTDFRNPFLMGLGLGARTRLLGFYVKFDYAYGIENKEMKSPISYITIGHDF